MVEGSYLKIALGLTSLKYTWIQKVINHPSDIYVVTFDSFYPDVHLSMGRLNKLKSSFLRTISFSGKDIKNNEIKLTPAIRLEDAKVNIGSSSLLLIRDIAGEYYRQKKQFPKNYPKVPAIDTKEPLNSIWSKLAVKIASTALGIPPMFECSEDINNKLHFKEVKRNGKKNME